MPCYKREIVLSKIKYEFTDNRVQICQKCSDNIWFGRNLFCKLFMRRAGSTLWPDPIAFVPIRARVEEEMCPLHKCRKNVTKLVRL